MGDPRRALDAACRSMGLHRVRRFGEIAVERGWIAPGQLAEGLQQAPATPERLGGFLVSRGWIQPSQLLELVQELERRELAPLPGGAEAPAEVREALAAPERLLDQYVLVRELGRGGAGQVWKAWDRALNRWVAVKLLRLETPEAVERLIREAQLAASLSHPNIVAVHGVGRRQGSPYLVLQLVDGAPATRALPVKRALEVVRDAASAVAFAHGKGIIHRDLKPGNLLIDREGRVYVADFGLARRTEGGAGPTLPGSVLGTPAYMSPEQARGEQVGAAADIYSLGAVLYEFCTGAPPHSGDTAAAVLARAVSEEPRRPRELCPRLHRDIEAIILKAMARDPRERYGSAAELALDIDCYLAGESVQARRHSWSDRLGHWARRHRRAAAAGIFMVLVVAGSAVAVAVLHRRSSDAEADRERLIQERERRRKAEDLLVPAIHALDRWERDGRRPRAADVEPVEQAIRSALTACPDYGPAWIEEGRRRWMAGEPAGAEEAFGLAMKDPSTVFRAHYYRARVRCAALEEIRRLPELPGTAEVARGQETAAEKKLAREITEDLAAFARGADLGADDPRVGYVEGLMGLFRASRPADFLEAAERMQPAADSLRVPRREACYFQGLARYFGLDFPGALAAMDRAIQSDAEIPAAWRLRGLVQVAMAEAEQAAGRDGEPAASRAVSDFGRALKLSPRSADFLAGRGMAGWRLALIRHAKGVDAFKELDQALDDYTRSLELDSSIAGIWGDRGTARSTRGEWLAAKGSDPMPDFEAAVADQTRAIHMDARMRIAWNQRGIVHRRMAEWRYDRGEDGDALLRQALEDHSAALALDGSSLSALIGRGNALWLQAEQQARRRGDPAGAAGAAVADFTRVIELNNRHAVAWLNRGRLRRLVADWKRSVGGDPAADLEAASNDMSEAIRINPGWDLAYVVRGKLHHAEGRWAAAQSDLEKAVELNPANERKCRGLIENCVRKLGGS